jgi:DNA-binding transcriptional LysR family regulator
MELRHLRYFLAVAEELHFGRAAARIHIAQPPLSRQIRQLEEEMGVELFKRTKQSVQLTAAGKIFQKEAYNVLESLTRGISKAKLASRGEAGSLSIGSIGSAYYVVLPQVLREFRKNFPEVELILQPFVSPEQNQMLLEKRIDVSFGRFFKPEKGIVFETVYEEELVAALPASHQFARKKVLSLSELKNEPYILFPNLPSVHAEYIFQVFAAEGLSPKIIQTVNEMYIALGLVAAGIGITLVPSSFKGTQQKGIVYIPLKKPAPVLELMMGYREQDDSPVLKRFLEIVHSISEF